MRVAQAVMIRVTRFGSTTTSRGYREHRPQCTYHSFLQFGVPPPTQLSVLTVRPRPKISASPQSRVGLCPAPLAPGPARCSPAEPRALPLGRGALACRYCARHWIILWIICKKTPAKTRTTSTTGRHFRGSLSGHSSEQDGRGARRRRGGHRGDGRRCS